MATVLAFMNLKGGVGKTTLTAALAREFAKKAAKKILLIDLDPQCNLSSIFFDPDEIVKFPQEQTVLHALYPVQGHGRAKLCLKGVRQVFSEKTLFHSKRAIDLLPGSMEIYRIIATAGANEAQYCIQNFEEVISEAAGYDFVFIDTNPSANLATMCALQTAHFVVAPMAMDIFSVRGIRILKEVFADKYRWLNEDQRIVGIWNKVDSKLRGTDATSRLERALAEANPEIFRWVLVNRIYETNHLHYEGSKKGFAQDQTGVKRPDFFSRVLAELEEVCAELLQRIRLVDA
jgi:cellulose biosynthesis protein BcsQ